MTYLDEVIEKNASHEYQNQAILTMMANENYGDIRDKCEKNGWKQIAINQTLEWEEHLDVIHKIRGISGMQGISAICVPSWYIEGEPVVYDIWARPQEGNEHREIVGERWILETQAYIPVDKNIEARKSISYAGLYRLSEDYGYNSIRNNANMPHGWGKHHVAPVYADGEVVECAETELLTYKDIATSMRVYESPYREGYKDYYFITYHAEKEFMGEYYDTGCSKHECVNCKRIYHADNGYRKHMVTPVIINSEKFKGLEWGDYICVACASKLCAEHGIDPQVYVSDNSLPNISGYDNMEQAGWTLERQVTVRGGNDKEETDEVVTQIAESGKNVAVTCDYFGHPIDYADVYIWSKDKNEKSNNDNTT